MPQASNRPKELFLAALDLPSAERAVFLAQSCGADESLRRQVEAMLQAHDDPGSFLEKPAAALGPTAEIQNGKAASSEPLGVGPGTRIGNYKLLEQIGEGGMGVVFMAEQQQPVRRLVALKIIKPGLDSAQVLARFEAERQALALMDHPNIARVLDAGTTRDPDQVSAEKPLAVVERPYFVMELVKGLPITQYCDKRRLTPRQRLELFIPVCQAIQHAHQKAIIHRDLKPSNVLIALYDGKPVPKVIDFGVAKATGQQLTERTLFTGFGSVVGTLEYMSPEQAELNQMDVDTRSDIYSLGVLLYELLTGTTPLGHERLKQGALLEVLRIIREEEPPKPSTRLSTSGKLAALSEQRCMEAAKLTRLVRGDIDWIVMKALDKDRNRRYETAAALGKDLERFLGDEPVQAGPPGTLYRLRKLVKRKRGMVLATLLLALTLLTGMAGTVWGLFEAWHQRDTAEQAQREESIQRTKAVVAEKDKGQLVQILLEQGRRIDGQRLLFQSEILRPNNPTLALLLAIEGAEKDPGLLATNTLLSTLDSCREERMLPADGAGVLCFSPDDRRLLTASSMEEHRSKGSTFRVWDVATGKQLVQFEKPDADRVWYNAAVFSPDGTRVLTSSYQGRVRLWDTATGKALALLEEGLTVPRTNEQWLVPPAEFSPDGRAVLTCFGQARLRDTRTGKELLVLSAEKGPIYFATLSGDGKKILTASGNSASADSTAVIWASATGKKIQTLQGPPHERITAARFSPDGLRALTIGENVRLWDVETGQELAQLEPPYAFSPRFSPDGKQILSKTRLSIKNRTLDACWQFWDAGGKPLFRMYINSAFRDSSAACFGPQGSLALYGMGSKGVSLWNASGTQRQQTLVHGREVVTVAFSPEGQRLATADALGVHLWAIGGEAARRLGRWPAQFPVLAVSPDGRRLATRTSRPAEIAVWDRSTGQQLLRFTGKDMGEVGLARFSPEGNLIAFGEGFWNPNQPSTLCLGDLRSGQVKFLTDQQAFADAEFSPDGTRLVTNQGKRRFCLWDPASGKQVYAHTLGLTPQGGNADFFSGRITFSPDGRWLVTTLGSRGLVLRDARTGQEVRSLLSHLAFASALVSPDGRHVLTWGPDVPTVWELDTGKKRAVLATAEGRFQRKGFWTYDDDPYGACSPAFSRDGRWILASCRDGTAGIWETDSGKQLLLLKDPDTWIFVASLSPDKTRVVGGCHDRTVRLWDARTGQLQAVYRGHEDNAFYSYVPFPPQFLPDGQILSLDRGGAGRVWPIEPLATARARAPRKLTEQELVQYGMLVIIEAKGQAWNAR